MHQGLSMGLRVAPQNYGGWQCGGDNNDECLGSRAGIQCQEPIGHPDFMKVLATVLTTWAEKGLATIKWLNQTPMHRRTMLATYSPWGAETSLVAGLPSTWTP